ncbi:hypothetical protein PC39_14117 [Salinisphaera sp. PC39]
MAVISTRDDAGHYYGLTMNAVTSLSLEPPLYLICLDRRSNTLGHMLRSRVFGLSFLRADQGAISDLFAGKGDDKFEGVDFSLGHDGVPLIDGALARMVCAIEQTHPGGDHTIVVGRVRDCDVAGGSPLIFYRGRYLRDGGA